MALVNTRGLPERPAAVHSVFGFATAVWFQIASYKPICGDIWFVDECIGDLSPTETRIGINY